MTAAPLLARLAVRGVRVSAADGDLVVRFPRGVLTEADREDLRASKAELLALLDPEAPAADEPEPEPDSYGQIMKDWLGDIVTDGSLLKHLGERSRDRAERLLAQDELDIEAARDLIHRSAALSWPARYKAANVRHEVLNPRATDTREG